VLENSANKIQLSTLNFEQILTDKICLQNVTQEHQLVATGDEAVLTQVSKGRKMPCLDLVSTQKDADIIITQQAIYIANEDPDSRVCVLCDDTYVFALLLFFY